jgi:hypothetical protein
MKKIICIIFALALVFGLCSCSTTPKDKECIGYVIIPHADGDEHADIYNYVTMNGNVCAYCLDGRKIVSPQIIVVLEEN